MTCLQVWNGLAKTVGGTPLLGSFRVPRWLKHWCLLEQRKSR